MSQYSNSMASNYTPHVLPSPTPIHAKSPFSIIGSNTAVVDGPVEPKYLREKIASTFLVIYYISGFFFAILATVALAILIASFAINGQLYRNVINIILISIGLVCILTSAVFTMLITGNPGYNYDEDLQKRTEIFYYCSTALVLAAVGMFFSGLFSDKIAELQGSFIGFVYGLIGMQIARECAADKDEKQSSLLVPYKLA